MTKTESKMLGKEEESFKEKKKNKKYKEPKASRVRYCWLQKEKCSLN